jgi:uncharacterized protein YlxW (UPF0749 family)
VQRWIVPVTTVSMIFGTLIAIQWRSQADARKVLPSRRVEDLVVLLKTTEKANQQLGDQVHELQSQITKAAPADAAWPADAPRVTDYPPMHGPGLVVRVTESAPDTKLDDGTSAVVHAEDLLKIVNELRTGGAEAVSVNGHRLTETSEIVTAGQHIVINKVPVRAPYVVQAIGPAEEMKTTLGLRGGVVEYLQFYGIAVETKPAKDLQVPAARGPRTFKFARPAPGEGETKPALPLP